MLANLPAKRSTRKLVSHYDGVRRRKKKELEKVKQKKVKCGKVIYSKSSNIKENTEKTINRAIHHKPQKPSQSSNIRSLRSLNRVLSSRILDTNSKLSVKRKLKVLNDRRRTRQSNVTNKTRQKEKYIEDVSQSSTSPQTRKKTEKSETSTPETPKRTSPRTTKMVRKLAVKKLLTGNINIKSFFPVKKRKDKMEDKFDVTSENIVEKHTRSKKKLVEQPEEKEEKVPSDNRSKKNDKFNNIIKSLAGNKKKNTKKISQIEIAQNNESDSNQTIQSKENSELTKRKRKLKQSFKNVINRVKKLKIDSTTEKLPVIDKSKSPAKSPFLDKAKQEKDPVKIVIPSTIEAKENIADISDTAHTVIKLNETNEDSPVPENIFKLDSNNEKSLQAKGEPNFDSQPETTTETTNIQNKLSFSNDQEKLQPISIETSVKPKVVAMISPNMKGKIRKPARGLNDCIAMLTSKLQQKSIDPPTLSNSEIPSSMISPKIVTDPSPQKAECILKIPTFKTQSEPTEDIALDLSTKSKHKDNNPFLPAPNKILISNDPPWQFTKLTSVESIIENVVSNSLQGSPQIKLPSPYLFNSIDTTIQNVIDGHMKQQSIKPLENRTSVDDIIDYVINFGNYETDMVNRSFGEDTLKHKGRGNRKIGSIRRVKRNEIKFDIKSIIGEQTDVVVQEVDILNTEVSSLDPILTKTSIVEAKVKKVAKKIGEIRKNRCKRKPHAEKLLVETHIDPLLDIKEILNTSSQLPLQPQGTIKDVNQDEPHVLENKVVTGNETSLTSLLKNFGNVGNLFYKTKEEKKNLFQNNKQNLRTFRKQNKSTKSSLDLKNSEVSSQTPSDDIQTSNSIDTNEIPIGTNEVLVSDDKIKIGKALYNMSSKIAKKIDIFEKEFKDNITSDLSGQELVPAEVDTPTIENKAVPTNTTISFKTKKKKGIRKFKFTQKKAKKLNASSPVIDEVQEERKITDTNETGKNISKTVKESTTSQLVHDEDDIEAQIEITIIGKPTVTNIPEEASTAVETALDLDKKKPKQLIKKSKKPDQIRNITNKTSILQSPTLILDKNLKKNVEDNVDTETKIAKQGSTDLLNAKTLIKPARLKAKRTLRKSKQSTQDKKGVDFKQPVPSTKLEADPINSENNDIKEILSDTDIISENNKCNNETIQVDNNLDIIKNTMMDTSVRENVIESEISYFGNLDKLLPIDQKEQSTGKDVIIVKNKRGRKKRADAGLSVNSNVENVLVENESEESCSRSDILKPAEKTPTKRLKSPKKIKANKNVDSLDEEPKAMHITENNAKEESDEKISERLTRSKSPKKPTSEKINETLSTKSPLNGDLKFADDNVLATNKSTHIKQPLIYKFSESMNSFVNTANDASDNRDEIMEPQAFPGSEWKEDFDSKEKTNKSKDSYNVIIPNDLNDEKSNNNTELKNLTAKSLNVAVSDNGVKIQISTITKKERNSLSVDPLEEVKAEIKKVTRRSRSLKTLNSKKSHIDSDKIKSIANLTGVSRRSRSLKKSLELTNDLNATLASENLQENDNLDNGLSSSSSSATDINAEITTKRSNIKFSELSTDKDNEPNEGIIIDSVNPRPLLKNTGRKFELKPSRLKSITSLKEHFNTPYQENTFSEQSPEEKSKMELVKNAKSPLNEDSTLSTENDTDEIRQMVPPQEKLNLYRPKKRGRKPKWFKKSLKTEENISTPNITAIENQLTNIDSNKSRSVISNLSPENTPLESPSLESDSNKTDISEKLLSSEEKEIIITKKPGRKSRKLPLNNVNKSIKNSGQNEEINPNVDMLKNSSIITSSISTSNSLADISTDINTVVLDSVSKYSINPLEDNSNTIFNNYKAYDGLSTAESLNIEESISYDMHKSFLFINIEKYTKLGAKKLEESLNKLPTDHFNIPEDIEQNVKTNRGSPKKNKNGKRLSSINKNVENTDKQLLQLENETAATEAALNTDDIDIDDSGFEDQRTTPQLLSKTRNTETTIEKIDTDYIKPISPRKPGRPRNSLKKLESELSQDSSSESFKFNDIGSNTELTNIRRTRSATNISICSNESLSKLNDSLDAEVCNILSYSETNSPLAKLTKPKRSSSLRNIHESLPVNESSETESLQQSPFVRNKRVSSRSKNSRLFASEELMNKLDAKENENSLPELDFDNPIHEKSIKPTLFISEKSVSSLGFTKSDIIEVKSMCGDDDAKLLVEENTDVDQKQRIYGRQLAKVTSDMFVDQPEEACTNPFNSDCLTQDEVEETIQSESKRPGRKSKGFKLHLQNNLASNDILDTLDKENLTLDDKTKICSSKLSRFLNQPPDSEDITCNSLKIDYMPKKRGRKAKNSKLLLPETSINQSVLPENNVELTSEETNMESSAQKKCLEFSEAVMELDLVDSIVPENIDIKQNTTQKRKVGRPSTKSKLTISENQLDQLDTELTDSVIQNQTDLNQKLKKVGRPKRLKDLESKVAVDNIDITITGDSNLQIVSDCVDEPLNGKNFDADKNESSEIIESVIISEIPQSNVIFNEERDLTVEENSGGNKKKKRGRKSKTEKLIISSGSKLIIDQITEPAAVEGRKTLDSTIKNHQAGRKAKQTMEIDSGSQNEEKYITAELFPSTYKENVNSESMPIKLSEYTSQENIELNQNRKSERKSRNSKTNYDEETTDESITNDYDTSSTSIIDNLEEKLRATRNKKVGRKSKNSKILDNNLLNQGTIEEIKNFDAMFYDVIDFEHKGSNVHPTQEIVDHVGIEYDSTKSELNYQSELPVENSSFSAFKRQGNRESNNPEDNLGQLEEPRNLTNTKTLNTDITVNDNNKIQENDLEQTNKANPDIDQIKSILQRATECSMLQETISLETKKNKRGRKPKNQVINISNENLDNSDQDIFEVNSNSFDVSESFMQDSFNLGQKTNRAGTKSKNLKSTNYEEFSEECGGSLSGDTNSLKTLSLSINQSTSDKLEDFEVIPTNDELSTYLDLDSSKDAQANDYLTSSKSDSSTESPDVKLLEEKIRNAIRQSLLAIKTSNTSKYGDINNVESASMTRREISETITTEVSVTSYVEENRPELNEKTDKSKKTKRISKDIEVSETNTNTSETRSLRKKSTINYTEVEDNKDLIDQSEVGEGNEVEKVSNDDRSYIEVSLNVNSSMIQSKLLDESRESDVPINDNNTEENDQNTKDVLSETGTHILKENLSKNNQSINKKRAKLRSKKGKRLTKNKISITPNIEDVTDPKDSEPIDTNISEGIFKVDEQTTFLSTVSPIIDSIDKPPIKLIINKHKARRKSKNIKKVGVKGHNDLYEDFSLVIKKKRITFSPPDTFSKEDTYPMELHHTPKMSIAFPEKDDLNDSVQEMDMELDEIPIESNIIETPKLELSVTNADENSKSIKSVDINAVHESTSLDKTSKKGKKKEKTKKLRNNLLKSTSFIEESTLEINEKPVLKLPLLKISTKLNNTKNICNENGTSFDNLDDIISEKLTELENNTEHTLAFESITVIDDKNVDDTETSSHNFVKPMIIRRFKKSKKKEAKRKSKNHILNIGVKQCKINTVDVKKHVNTCEENTTNINNDSIKKSAMNEMDSSLLEEDKLIETQDEIKEIEQSIQETDNTLADKVTSDVADEPDSNFIVPDVKVSKRGRKKRGCKKSRSELSTEKYLDTVDAGAKEASNCDILGNNIFKEKELQQSSEIIPVSPKNLELDFHNVDDVQKEDIDKIYAFSETEDFDLEKPIELPPRLQKKLEMTEKVESKPIEIEIKPKKSAGKRKSKTVNQQIEEEDLSKEKSPLSFSGVFGERTIKETLKCAESPSQSKKDTLNSETNVINKDLIDSDVAGGKKSMRTAKVKALEHIHDSLNELETIGKNVSIETTSVESVSKKMKSKKKNQKEVADVDAPIEVIGSEIPILEDFVHDSLNELEASDKIISKDTITSVESLNKKTKTNKKNLKSVPEFDFAEEVLTTETPLLEDLVAELDGFEELDNSIERELRAEMIPENEENYIYPGKSKEEHKQKEINTEDSSGTTIAEENQELRRSRRGSRKVASYNENDLIDPLIDAIENKRKCIKKGERDGVDIKQKKGKEPERKLNSEELFDLLKASTNDNLYVPKPPNSFLATLEDSSRDMTDDAFDNMFENMLEKTTFLTQEKLMPRRKEDIDKIYEFTESPENVTSNMEDDSLTKVSRKSRNVPEDIEPILTPQDSNSDSRSKSDKFESNYCEICNKSFVKLENLIKHRRTLTHIQKLSEIEAKEAEKSKIISRHEDENSRESVIEPPSLIESASLAKTSSLLDHSKDHELTEARSDELLENKRDMQIAYSSNNSLKLADIISDVINEPDLKQIEDDSKKMTELVQNNDIKRYKSLGERKSFDSDTRMTSEAHLTESIESKTTILEKQISLLENIIENQTTHNYIDDISMSSEKSDITSIPSTPSITKPSSDNTSFIKPTQYEEISDDSANIRNYDDPKLRKTLNRDEELFLECCSLLKSSSEVSSSYSNKKMQEKVVSALGLRPVDEPQWSDKKNLSNNDLDVMDDYSDNSRIPTPLGNSYDDDASDSNTISSNWGINKTADESGENAGKTRFTFENISVVQRDDTNELKFEGLLQQDRGEVDENQDTICQKNSSDFSDGSISDHKKIVTKGARKVFEGLKVSIPTEELNLEEVLNYSPKQKKPDTTAENTEEEKLLISPTQKSRNSRKSKPVKKAQVGSNLLFKVNKKKLPSPSISSKDLQKDVYDFEETQDNTDVFTKPDFRAFRNMKTGENEGETESRECIDIPEPEPEATVSNSVASTAKQAKENITKKKCMIMGRIFKNAAKSKIEDIDEEIRNIPEIDNEELVESYVANCNKLATESEKNEVIEEYIQERSGSEKDSKVSSRPKTEVKKQDNSKKKLKTKAKKRPRTNSDSTDDEFGLNKATKRRSNKKNVKEEDNVINLEQELKECIGVASRKSQRKCTSGKQNVLVEYWSSDDSQFEALLEKQIIEIKPKEKPIEKIIEETLEQPKEVPAKEPRPLDAVKKPLEAKKVKKKQTKKKAKSQEVTVDGVPVNRRKRAAVNPLYHWSSSSEDEADDLIEVRPLRDEIEDDEDRPVQHGWIVGDSPKKLVTMLAQAKGKKADIDCVKEQGKKRTNTVS
uniref:Titin-like n=1 Tax=Diabrotica virgifera virgifera TaxID=50390 RepID=A0A6P7H1R8_DIAVI